MDHTADTNINEIGQIEGQNEAVRLFSRCVTWISWLKEVVAMTPRDLMFLSCGVLIHHYWSQYQDSCPLAANNLVVNLQENSVDGTLSKRDDFCSVDSGSELNWVRI
ncbi:hypothetical protein MMH89_00790 [Candidatus Comchoanobacter bicostacola]|uniref:Uncharacterized protein n=1 Tax=Candidatus Comchoanobacter bicostacola TaxID=2919598 RepID=A0ABY5DLR4_9GAMM|nr:hypothetical protein [Candidatus Comchoanobacter bicostacola]UTC24700.1 hypothetical protein MMH89_00790 [Candidatus Comchoanobacter bicostacola]